MKGTQDTRDIIDFDLPLHTHGDPYLGFEHLFDFGIIEGSGEVEKRWGRENIVVNNGAYCGKVLSINEGRKTSYHWHNTKTETFFVLSGDCVVYSGSELNIDSIVELRTGDSLHMPAGVRHCIACPCDNGGVCIVEFSTRDDPEDSYRTKFPN